MTSERIASVYESARRIARELHKQGLRPTRQRILALLPRGSVKNWAVLQAAVKRAQRFLGLDPTLTTMQSAVVAARP